eukprot:CAMPEP_0195149326 /NCGR_PEP_ID=MMETSP0448-20130528/176877_1 /TAXON_ID=66468 /ORGANISM="Heterocapsa triquestra, Strain CCMP 448" /LENGTH=149 /DNA_ID=CAMNT_0040187971 /DNA_START=36 /DNA_END=481 /DNA_ORIENTATION=-
MKPRTPFDKMMRAWCQHHGLPLAQARFVLGDRELRPEDTPQGCGCVAGGVVEIHARPREATSAEAAPVEANLAAAGSPADPASALAAPAADVADGKIEVQVVAEGDEGENVIDFKMKLSSPFEKMMQAWCRHHEVPFGEACFEFGGREL